MNEVDEDRPTLDWVTAKSEESAAIVVPDPASRYEPFALTDVQRAYWLGRTNYFELGNIGCHVYFEFDVRDLDRGRMQAAWQKLIDRHDMLRAMVGDDGLQQILPHTPHYEIKNMNLRGVDQSKEQSELEAIRHQMSHQVFPPNRWPLFELRTTELNGQTLLHLSLDLLFIDLWSMQILFDEWSQLAFDQDAYLAPLEISFRDYLVAAAQHKESESYRRSVEYWLRRLNTLPPSPKLPLAKSPSAIRQPRFVRREAVLGRELWRNLRNRIAKRRMTPSGMLMAAFARILAAWSQNPHFTLNITLFERAPLHPHVYRLVGDFTSILLLEIHDDGADSLEVLARRIATQFRSDLEHREYGGLQLLQEIAKRADPDHRPSMPVVFTSALAQSMPGWQSVDQFGEVTYGVTQTPQVYLDHQVYQRAGNLHLTWDAIEELFPPGLLDDMFEAYSAYLRRLAQDDAAWGETKPDIFPPAQLAQRAAVNDTAALAPAGLLQEPFLEQVRKWGHHTAVATWERRLSYEDVDRHARRLARRLRQMGAAPNRLVAVVMEKGWDQVVSVIAILQAGGAYLPIDPDLPQERCWLLLQRGEVEIVLTQPCVAERLNWPTFVQCVSVDWQQQNVGQDDEADEPLEPVQRSEDLTSEDLASEDPASKDLAYVIFTSGSTGEPKGVMVEHRSALNTVLDINERFGVGADDRVLALSSLSFDLSVYDIFGTLAAGGTIVLPHPTSSREPGDWAYLVLQEKVTIWNSVPALLEILVDHVGTHKELLGNSLRLTLLSGDWIPVGLPDRARALLPGLRLISLGGATEAAIWSIFHPVDAVSPEWRSVPYGRPLRNHQMHVLNDTMSPCPTWVPGQIHIAGLGLARGYWKDEAKTEAHFVRHPHSGERLYRTGDLGRYMPDGTIELLGREDEQVKVQGYRMDLGEIEAALERHPKVKAAVVTAVGERAAPKHLVAYVVAAAPGEELADYLRQKLPSYMVPSVWQKLDALPLTANGKVNRRALPAPVAKPDAGGIALGDQSDALARLTALISEELAQRIRDPRQNLLTIGATSMDLVRIVGRLEKEFGFRPSFQEFFRDPTVAALARLVEQRRKRTTSDSATAPPPPRRALELIVDPAERDAFRLANHGVRVFPGDWGRLPLLRELLQTELEERVRQRRTIRRFLPAPVPLASLGAWLAELSRLTIGGAVRHAYGSAGGCYPVQTYLHAKPEGVAGCPAGTFYYHPIEHCLVPLTLGAELDPAAHEPFTNRPIFEQARFSLFFVSQPRAIEPMYGDLALRFSLLEAGAMAQAVESSAWRFGLGLCPIGWLDFTAIHGLFHVEDGQELLHAHVGGLAEALRDSGDWEQGVI
jgi:amino acid adenylation domain-containing protein